ncbi:MAG: PadR family transcriptional regulator [Anaerolineae bacterium]|jgi:DNA-binding PadR family transcriptional regulator
MNYRYFVLGLLAQRPMSGYDIKCFFESFGWLIHGPSLGSLYPMLHALQADGCLTMQVTEGESGLLRKVYMVTEVGQQAFKTWVDESIETDKSLKTFLMHLMVADNLSRETLLTHLEQRRSQLADYQTALEQANEQTGDNGDFQDPLALDYGRVMAEAETVWLNHKLAQLCQSPCESAVEE